MDLVVFLSRLATGPTLAVASEAFPLHEAVRKKDPTVPEGERVWFKGYMVTMLDYIAQGLNFSYTFVRPSDGSWGTLKSDGTWTGMVGQVYRQEVDIGLGPFGVGIVRYMAVDFTSPLFIEPVRVFAGRGRPEVDPWSFVFPLASLVWVAILTTLMLLPVLMLLQASCFTGDTLKQYYAFKKFFNVMRVLLQQAVNVNNEWKWWERVMLGAWMLTTLVLTRSYAGNLMSLLAVRHIPQPYQSLRDVLDDPAVIMIWHKNSLMVQSLLAAESGVLLEAKNQGKYGRLEYMPMTQYAGVLDKDIKSGRKVILDVDTITFIIKGQQFSRTGSCDYYSSREEILPRAVSMIGQKSSPIVTSLSKRIMSMNEAGLYNFWYISAIPNSTSCVQPPSKITVSTPLSLATSWGMFVMVGSGLALSLLLLSLELAAHNLSR